MTESHPEPTAPDNDLDVDLDVSVGGGQGDEPGQDTATSGDEGSNDAE